MSLLFEEIPLSPKLELCRATNIRFGITASEPGGLPRAPLSGLRLHCPASAALSPERQRARRRALSGSDGARRAAAGATASRASAPLTPLPMLVTSQLAGVLTSGEDVSHATLPAQQQFSSQSDEPTRRVAYKRLYTPSQVCFFIVFHLFCCSFECCSRQVLNLHV